MGGTQEASRYDVVLGEPRSKRTQVAVLVLTNLVSLGCLVWTLRDAQLGRLLTDFAALNWWTVGAAVVLELSVYLCQAFRWKMILSPVVWLSFRQSARAVYGGMFASETLPARAGEVLRCYLVSRWTALPFSVAVSSVVIERIFDALLMWIGLQWALSSLNLPRQFNIAGDSLGLFVVIAVGLLAVALFTPRPAHTAQASPGWKYRLWVLRDDLAQIGHSWSLAAGFLAAIGYLGLQVTPIWILVREYGFDVPLKATVALMLILRLASALPQAPATIGVFQFVTREFLEKGFGVLPDEAARFSLLLWGVVKLPVMAAGFLALSITGAKIGELTRAAREESENLSRGG